MRSFRRFFLAVVTGSMVMAAPAGASLLQVSSDPFTDPNAQHATEVEPHVFAAGSTLVGAFQTARIAAGGSDDIGFVRSTNGGSAWTKGFLPGITPFFGTGGRYSAVSDPAVVYDRRHNTWLIVSLAIGNTTGSNDVLVSRSTDGGAVWGNPVRVAAGNAVDFFDKTWITCDDTPTSNFYGHCYATWDDANTGELLTSTSVNGGLTWGAAQGTANTASGIGGQPLVQPNGTVIVPASDAAGGHIIDYVSTNGGASWSTTHTATFIRSSVVAGNFRASPLPSATIDKAGRVYVAWMDCRFRTGCASNDIVYTSTTNGLTWAAVKRVPIDATTSTVDHFDPGLGVDPATSGTSAHLALTYYYYPVAHCTNCVLDVGYTASANGGATWSAPTKLAGPMQISWLANSQNGLMVGDYIATVFSGNTAHSVFADALAPSAGKFRESMYTFTGLPVPRPGSGGLSAAGDRPVFFGPSDHGAPFGPLTLTLRPGGPGSGPRPQHGAPEKRRRCSPARCPRWRSMRHPPRAVTFRRGPGGSVVRRLRNA